MIRNKIVQLGQVRIVILITIISIVVSICVYIPIGLLIEDQVNLAGIIIATLASIIIAPAISWYMVGLLIKIHHLEVEMRKLATYDSLTNVFSRKAFLTNSESLLNLTKRNKSILAILYIDIDNFKQINDTYGHNVGDEVLKSFGKILKNSKRESDIVGRLGGEEFAFLLSKTDIKGAIEFANKLHTIINKDKVSYNNTILQYTASIGVSIFNQNNQVELQILLQQSDEALYQAKHSGKNCTKLYKENLINTKN